MIYFIVYLFLEVIVSVNIASALGGFLTFLEIIFSAFLGFVILVNFRETLSENFRALSRNAIDIQQFQSLNLFTIIGAFLLIIPGFLTDIIGILLQFSVFTSMLVNHFAKSNKTNFKQNNKQKDSDVIDVEIVDDTTFIK